MKKSLILGVLVLLAGAGALLAASTPGGINVAGLGLGGTERAWLSDRTYDFLEDLRFKDFAKASTYHLAKTQAARDIPEMIHRAFLVRHEVLDIQRFEVTGVDLDRSGARARVRALVYYRVLGDEKVREDPDSRRNLEMLFYWFKQEDGTWAMELESSLR